MQLGGWLKGWWWYYCNLFSSSQSSGIHFLVVKRCCSCWCGDDADDLPGASGWEQQPKARCPTSLLTAVSPSFPSVEDFIDELRDDGIELVLGNPSKRVRGPG